MITAQLGPPPAVTGRIGAEGAPDQAWSDLPDASGEGDFMSLLLGLAPPVPEDPGPEAHITTAAGPLTGELLNQIGADVVDLTAGPVPDAAAHAAAAAGSQTLVLRDAGVIAPTQADGRPIAGSAAPAPPTVVSASPAAGPGTSAPANMPAPANPAAASAVPAPAESTAPVAARPQPASTATTAAIPVATDAQDAAPAPAAVVTMTLARTPAPAAAAPAAAPAAAEQPGRPAAADAAPPAAAAVAAPVAHTAAPKAPAHVVLPGAVTTAADLAQELGSQVRMSVREGGRELVLSLRPQELGHLTVRVTVMEGVLTAQITADRPEAARMLSQSLSQLGQVLGDMGYAVDGLDIAYGGDRREDAPGTAWGTGESAADCADADDADGRSALTGAAGATTPAAGGASATGLDILA